MDLWGWGGRWYIAPNTVLIIWLVQVRKSMSCGEGRSALYGRLRTTDLVTQNIALEQKRSSVENEGIWTSN